MRYASAFLIALMFSNPINRPGLLRTGRPGLQLGRSVLLLGSTVFNFMAFRYLQLDEALAILFSTPFLVAILAGPILGEWVGWRRWTAIMVGFVGVLVVVRPGMGGLAVGGAALARQRVLLCRLQHHHAHAVARPIPARPRCSTPTCSAASSWCRCCRSSGRTPPSWIDVVLMVAIGALRRRRAFPADPGPPAARRPRCCRRSSIPRSSGRRTLGYLVFGNVPSHWTMAGAGDRHRLRPLSAQPRAQGDRQSCPASSPVDKIAPPRLIPAKA